MDIEKLKRCLKCCADDNSKACNKCELEYGEEECQNLCGYAATALSTLQAENEKLRDEVERQRRSADNRQHLYENAERAYMKVLAELEQAKREQIRIPEGYALVKLELLEELDNFRDLGPIDRLRELKQADDEGRCVMPPCKVGQKVKVDVRTWGNVWNYKTVENGKFLIGEIVAITKTKKQTLVKIRVEHNVSWKRPTRRYPASAIGKTVFLTREEAALRRARPGGHDAGGDGGAVQSTAETAEGAEVP